MIRLTLERLVSNNDATIGILKGVRHLNGDTERLFTKFACEDEYRTKKVYGETRIPAGTYWIGLRKEGGFHNRYAKKFGDWHRGMLHIQNVPNFEYILIHIGNTQKDTAGCICPGQAASLHSMYVQASTAAYRELYPPVAAALEQGEDVPISIIDRDRS